MRPYAEALSASPHAKTGCYACHLDSGWWDFARFKSYEGLVMYPRAALGAEQPSGPGIHVADTRCLRCHVDVLAKVTERGGMRIAHETCVEPRGTCDGCHTADSHGEATRWPGEYDMEACVRCHASNAAPKECDSCHQGKLARDRLRASAWRVTHGPRWSETHGAGALEYCVTCHPDDYCERCHGIRVPHPASYGRTHGADYIFTPGSCKTCHSKERFCDACHGVEMPHIAGFLKTHSAAADDRTDPRCVRCHHLEDCDACHVEHTHPGSTSGALGGG